MSDEIQGLSDRSALPTDNGRTVDRKVVRRDTTLPKQLESFFADPPLAGNEKREDYDDLLAALAAAAKPKDAIVWLFVRDIADLSWEIRRERARKLQAIKSAQIEQVMQLLSPQDNSVRSPWVDPETEEIARDAELWAKDLNARERINQKLEDKGYGPSDVFTGALNRRATDIDAIDRRIASYELRRMTAIREMERYSDSLARRIESVSSDFIEGKFTEPAE